MTVIWSSHVESMYKSLENNVNQLTRLIYLHKSALEKLFYKYTSHSHLLHSSLGHLLAFLNVKDLFKGTAGYNHYAA